MSDTKIEQQICDAISVITEKKISELEFDKTVLAVVEECTNRPLGEHRVRYQDSTFLAYAANPNNYYAPGNMVYVQIPKSNFAEKKVIVGGRDSFPGDILSENLFYGDTTEINGGNIRTGTVQAGALHIGLQNVSLTSKFWENYNVGGSSLVPGRLSVDVGTITIPYNQKQENGEYLETEIVFDLPLQNAFINAGANKLYWILAKIEDTDDDGVPDDVSLVAVLDTDYSTTMNQQSNTLQYKKIGMWKTDSIGFGTLALSLGRTIINGGDIITNTIDADRIKANTVMAGVSVQVGMKNAYDDDANAGMFISNQGYFAAGNTGGTKLLKYDENGDLVLIGGDITGGIITGGIITGGTFRTAVTGQRVEISDTNLGMIKLFDNALDVSDPAYISIAGTTLQVRSGKRAGAETNEFITGASFITNTASTNGSILFNYGVALPYATSSPGRSFELTSSSDSDNYKHPFLRMFYSDDSTYGAGLKALISSNSPTNTLFSMVQVRNSLDNLYGQLQAGLLWAVGDGSSATAISQRGVIALGAAINDRILLKNVSGTLEIRNSADNAFQNIKAQNLTGNRISLGADTLLVDITTGGVTCLTVRNAANTLYRPFRAEIIYETSEKSLKENIKSILDSDIIPLDVIKNVSPKQFNYIGDTETKLGFILEDLPQEFQHGGAYSLSELIATLWEALREVTTRVEMLEKKVLTKEIKTI